MMAELAFDVAIATRNRVQALSLSIPLLLQQSRRPNQIVVVDSSDEAAPVESLVDGLRHSSAVEIKLIRSAAGSALQRNICLTEVSADVVFFLDDDSLVLPGAFDAMMRIYERDKEGVVGGVCSAEAMTAPISVLDAAQATYRMSLYERLKQRISRVRYGAERILVPDPFLTHGRSRWVVQRQPDWLENENAVLVEYMTGFRMSFRTDVIKKFGFHEPLGGYALFEDCDASFGVLKTHLLVGARNAQIFHYKAPGSRASGNALGMMQILNRAYVLKRHAVFTPLITNEVWRFTRYKILQYAAAARSSFGRDRLHGATAAFRRLPELLAAEPNRLEEVYKRLCAQCLGE